MAAKVKAFGLNHAEMHMWKREWAEITDVSGIESVGIVQARGFENQRLRPEEVAEFRYRPTACHKSYRMAVVRKNISVEKGEQLLYDRVVYFFYITNLWENEADEIV